MRDGFTDLLLKSGGCGMSLKDFSDVCGNKKLIGHIKSEVKCGNIGHAYIIEGDSGVGKLNFAISFAAALLCEGDSSSLPCGECSPCKKVLSNSHPDLKIIDRGERATIGVDSIRALRSDAHVIPSEAEKKIYIIKDADTMTVQAQNAFLLTLEEPPAYVVYLLLCRDASAMLETIRSRAPSLRLCPAPNTELEEYLIERSPAAKRLRDTDEESWRELLVSASGNSGRAEKLLEGKALSERIAEKNEALALLRSLLAGDGDSYLTVMSLKKTKRDAVLTMLSDIISALRDMLVFKKVKSCDTCFFTSPEAARAAAASYSAKKLSLALYAVNSAVYKINSNAGIQPSLLSMAVNIKEIK